MALDWSGVDPGVPLLLLPVRVETQTAPVDPDQPDAPVVLRVRIHPDDVGLDRSAGRALLLPDSFVAVARTGDVVHVGEGRPVSVDHLGLGTPDGDPADRLEAMARSLDELTGSEDGSATAWLRSFEVAADAGMALTVPLPPGTEHVDSLVVLGVRAGRDPDEESAGVTAALRAHDGDAGFLRVGDATNNTEAGRSAWSRPDVEPMAGTGEPVDPPPASAADRLAAALGDPGNPLAHWPGADDPSESWACAMATALWPVTWGTFLERSVRPGVLDAEHVDAVRRHHASTVRGRGPLPVVRVGNQPYGVLPVTDLAHVTGPTPLDRRLARLLRRLSLFWSVGAGSVPSVPRGGVEDLPDVLGQSPVSWGLRLRRLLDTGGVLAHLVSGASSEQAQTLRRLADETARWLEVDGLLEPPDQLGVDRTLGLPMAADDDPEALAKMADGAPSGTASVLQVLLGVALGSVRARVDTLLTEGRLETLLASLDGGLLLEQTGPDVADALRHALEALGAGEPLGGEADDVRELLDRAQRDRGHVPVSVYPLAHLGPTFRRDSADALVDEVRRLLRAVAVRDEVTEAVRTLATVTDPDDRAALLAETLDCASHRYDAWVTSVATARLTALRGNRATGLAVGAVGWVEDLRLDLRTTAGTDADPHPAARGGAVLAPSLRHAATAAVLRGGRLAHAPGDDADRALELDLSSTRTRQAEEVLAGIRSGHELGALLGYRFERWLAEVDPGLNRFVASLRAMAPTVLAKEVDRVAEGAVDLGVESVAASQVVDGLRLLEICGPDVTAGAQRVLDGLAQAPAALQRYGAVWRGPEVVPPGPGGVPPGRDEPAELTGLLVRLGALLDAVGDLLLAEGVHQLVAGNTARAAAAMDGLSGDGLPPEPEVSAAVPDRAGLTHRLAVLASPAVDAPASDGWAAAPRARANPVVESWCRAVLGPATSVILAPGRTLDSVGVAALDVVESAGPGGLGLDVFWRRARLSHPDLPETPPTDRPAGTPADHSTLAETWRLAAALRALLADARPAQPADLVHDPHADALRADGATGPADPARVAVLRALTTSLGTVGAEQPTADPSGLAERLAAHGIGAELAPVEADALLAHVTAGVAEAAARAAEVSRLLDEATTGADLASAAGALTGSLLPVPQTLTPPAAAEPLGAAWSHGTGEGYAIRPWLARHARVRPVVARFTDAGLLRSATGRRGDLRAVTLHADAWHGEHLPGGATPESALTSLVCEVVPGADPPGPVAGLVLDGWHETFPRRRSLRDDTTHPADPDDEAAPLEQLSTAGLAVNANGPDARAPQGLLLAVAPDDAPWTRDRVLGLVDHVRDLARMRLVTLARLPLAGPLLPAATVAHWSLQGEPVLDPRVLTRLADVSATPHFVRFED